MNIKQFLDEYHNAFNSNPYKMTFELGASETDEIKRSRKAINRAQKIFNRLLKGKKIWIVLINWNTKVTMLEELTKCGFEIKDNNNLIEGKKEDLIVNYSLLNPTGTYYLYYEHINHSVIKKIITGIINNELGLEPYTGIGAYFISFFEHPIFLNVYDDRGMEILVNDKDYSKKIYSEFKDICLSHNIN